MIILSEILENRIIDQFFEAEKFPSALRRSGLLIDCIIRHFNQFPANKSFMAILPLKRKKI